MSYIRAVLVDKRAPANLSLGEIEKPSPAPSEALVRVSSISLNRGEVRRAQAAEPGFNPAGTLPELWSGRPPMRQGHRPAPGSWASSPREPGPSSSPCQRTL